MYKKKINLFFIAITLIIITTCATQDESSDGGGSGNNGSAVCENLTGAGEVSIAKWNTLYKYTMVTAEPSAKPEADSAATTSYSYTLTATGTSLSIIANTLSTSVKSASKQVYDSKQTNSDLIMRETENTLLAGKKAQLSKNTNGILAAAPASISVGTAWNSVFITITGNYINTTCQYISDHAYIFVDTRDTSAMSSYLIGYGTAFDAIYDINHDKFGTENDVDSNGKVIIVFSEELSPGYLGYFYAVDKFSKSYYSASNEGDIFYITTASSYQGDIVKGTLAHEFQHMIYFDQHYNNGVISTYSWLNEALSQAAEYYNNYTDNHLGWIESFLSGNYSGLSLTHWTSANYGYGAVFIRYIIDRFGDTAIKNMCSTGTVGISAVESSTGVDFNTLFNDFTQALVISGTGDSADPKYNFTTLDLQTVQSSGRGGLLYSATYTTPATVSSSTLKAYQLNFYKWTGTFGTISLTGTDIAGTVFGLSR